MLHGRPGIAVTLFVFDVLAVEGLPVTASPYRERRALLEALNPGGAAGAACGDVRGW
jgi:ATP-dependent DNA ligase